MRLEFLLPGNGDEVIVNMQTAEIVDFTLCVYCYS